MHKDVKEILINEKQIIEKTRGLAQMINKDYVGEKVVFVALLKGSVPFLSELIKHIDLDNELEFMKVSSYEGAKSSGNIKIDYDLTRAIENENVIIVEDIVDTGLTLEKIRKVLADRNPKSLKIITLLDKVEGRTIECEVDYSGFEIPNEFVVGYGLDFNELYRSLPYVGILKEECYK